EIGEANSLLALLGDRHGGDQHDELTGDEGRDDAAPGRGSHVALDPHLDAQRLADFDVETNNLSAGVYQVERGVDTFGTDGQLFGSKTAAGKHECSGSQQEFLVVLHGVLLPFLGSGWTCSV